MCGAYIGIDEYRSKLTVLKEKFEPQAEDVKSDDANVATGGRSVWSPNL